MVTLKSDLVDLFRLGYGLVFDKSKRDDLGRHVYEPQPMEGPATVAALLRVTDEGELMATTMVMGDDDDDGNNDDDGATTTTLMTTMASNNNEAIRKEIATFNRLSQCAEECQAPK